jgi:hypothetical protein
MQVREVKVEYGRTVNLGNYESERVQVGFAADLAPDEQEDQAAALRVAVELARQAREVCDERLRRFEQERRLQRQREYRIGGATPDDPDA